MVFELRRNLGVQESQGEEGLKTEYQRRESSIVKELGRYARGGGVPFKVLSSSLIITCI